MTTAVVGGTTDLFASAVAESGISMFSVGTDGSLTNAFNINDNDTFQLRGYLQLVAGEFVHCA